MVSLSHWERRKPAFCVSHVAGRSPHHTVLRKHKAKAAGSWCATDQRTGASDAYQAADEET